MARRPITRERHDDGKASPAGTPEPLGRPSSDRSLAQEELERGFPEEQKRERPGKTGRTQRVAAERRY